MRRTTPGVLGARELVDARIARAEEHDADSVVRVLEPLVTEARRARLREVIGRRLGSVAVVVDRPYDPHNGAAVLRSCEAFGVQQLHVVERPGTPFAVARSVARGAERWMDVTCHPSYASLLLWAASAELRLVGTHPHGTIEPDELAAIPRLGLVLGNEREGIGEDLASACAGRVRVPMRGFVESLNVSVTAAVLLHAATRCRDGDLDARARLRLYARGLYLSVAHAEEILAAQGVGGATERRAEGNVAAREVGGAMERSGEENVAARGVGGAMERSGEANVAVRGVGGAMERSGEENVAARGVGGAMERSGEENVAARGVGAAASPTRRPGRDAG
jgi:tRNA (guanosine-2'-O-)-methyltransferase